VAESEDQNMTAGPAPSGDILQITLTDSAAQEVRGLSELTGKPPDQLVATALGILRMAIQAKLLGERLVITTKRWWPVRELIVPKPI